MYLENEHQLCTTPDTARFSLSTMHHGVSIFSFEVTFPHMLRHNGLQRTCLNTVNMPDRTQRMESSCLQWGKTGWCIWYQHEFTVIWKQPSGCWVTTAAQGSRGWAHYQQAGVCSFPPLPPLPAVSLAVWCLANLSCTPCTRCHLCCVLVGPAKQSRLALQRLAHATRLKSTDITRPRTLWHT